MTLIPNQIYGITNCEICGSIDLSSNKEGFIVCTNCGIEQKTSNYAPTQDFDEHLNHKTHNVMTTITRTQIGNKYEQQFYNKYNKLATVNKIYQKQYRLDVYRSAYLEILRICSALSLPINFAKDSFTVFKKVWNKQKPGTKARSYKILVPVVIYKTTQMLKYTLGLEKIYDLIEISKEDFKDVLVATYKSFPKIDKTTDVLQRITRICNQLEMPNEVQTRAVKLLKSNCRIMLSTINKVAACSAVSMAVISLNLRSEYRIYKIGKAMNASSSAISARIKKVLKYRGLKKTYSAKDLDTIMPKIYHKLIK